jgi:hypothetical protein
MQKDQKLINEVKSSILEGYDVIPASVKINYSLEQIGLMNIYMNGFYEYLGKRDEEDKKLLNIDGTHSYYPEYIGNEYKYIVDAYFNNILGIIRLY